MTTPRQLEALYGQGQNLGEILRREKGSRHNDEEIIEISYDLQTGSYVAALEDEAKARCKEEYTAEIARTLLALGRPATLLEAGVGEATTLSGVLENLGPASVASYGFDLSWSRVAFARDWLESQGAPGVTLCTGSLFRIPFASSCIDIVYTSHSIEPNGGGERPILQELYRVARKFLVLLEPGYELAGAEARRRMEMHGYCKNLKDTCEELGYKVIEHKLFPVTGNPLNPTAVTVVEKRTRNDSPDHMLACPRFKTPLAEIGGLLFSPEALVVYPVVGGIPCLRIENGIVASKYPEWVEAQAKSGPQDPG